MKNFQREDKGQASKNNFFARLFTLDIVTSLRPNSSPTWKPNISPWYVRCDAPSFFTNFQPFWGCKREASNRARRYLNNPHCVSALLLCLHSVCGGLCQKIVRETIKHSCNMLYRLFTPGKADTAAETHLQSTILLNWVNQYLRKRTRWITTSLPA